MLNFWNLLADTVFGWRLKFKDESFILGCPYIPPEDSNIHKVIEVPLFSLINQEIDTLKNLGPILRIGDWNARLGNLKDYLDLDEFNDSWDFVVGYRDNVDSASKKIGLELLQRCHKFNMKILNRRWGNESNKCTHFHNIGVSGSSVVDWAIANEKMMQRIHSFSYYWRWASFYDNAELKVVILTEQALRFELTTFHWRSCNNIQEVLKLSGKACW